MENRGERDMSKPGRLVLLVYLWVCCYLLIHGALGSEETAESQNCKCLGRNSVGRSAGC